MTRTGTPPRFDPSEMRRIPAEVLTRYDVAGPRYTSYPTAPAWKDGFGEAGYVDALERSRERGRPLSIYVHLPFCESLCIYCGCSVVITKRRDRAQDYLDRLVKEMDRVAELSDAANRQTVQVAWGGGTPTFLTPDQIEWLLGHIGERFPFAPDAELGIEVDPRVTTKEHVEAIARAGFNRISMGIQDFDPAVQKEIHRVQPFELTRDLIGWCREAGLESVNVDLVYGLPKQNLEGFTRSLGLVNQLAPDRVSAFSYAHVPWLKPAQQHFKEDEIPRGPEKFELFVTLIEHLTSRGYDFIGMDHFAKEGNELSVAQATGELWRNFQGFTTRAGTDLLGMGVTSIGSLADTFVQNEKELGAYQESCDAGELPARRGMVLSADDLLRQAVIQDIMCRYSLRKADFEAEHDLGAGGFDAYFAEDWKRLEPHAQNGMIVLDDEGFELTSRGRVFVRNVCMAFDAYLPRGEDAGQRMFSRTL